MNYPVYTLLICSTNRLNKLISNDDNHRGNFEIDLSAGTATWRDLRDYALRVDYHSIGAAGETESFIECPDLTIVNSYDTRTRKPTHVLTPVIRYMPEMAGSWIMPSNTNAFKGVVRLQVRSAEGTVNNVTGEWMMHLTFMHKSDLVKYNML